MKKLLPFLLLCTTCVFAKEGDIFEPDELPASDKYPDPWFTGPLLTPSGHIVPIGFINVEPYAYAFVGTGDYDSDWHGVSAPHFYTALFQLPMQIGITEWADVIILPQASWNGTQGVSSTVFNDFILGLEIQLIKDTAENGLPGLKMYVDEIFPTGPYQNGDPEDLGTDFGGGGSYQTTVGLVLTRLFHIYHTQYLAVRFDVGYNIPSSVSVKGLNTYGGALDTDGKVKPGQSFVALLGLEYSLSQNFALACDISANYQKRTRFSGTPGTNDDGSLTIVGGPESFQFSLAPAIEYMYSQSLGIIGGVWFTVAGKNSDRFIAGVIAINYYGPFFKQEEEKPPHQYRSKGGGV